MARQELSRQEEELRSDAGLRWAAFKALERETGPKTEGRSEGVRQRCLGQRTGETQAAYMQSYMRCGPGSLDVVGEAKAFLILALRAGRRTRDWGHTGKAAKGDGGSKGAWLGYRTTAAALGRAG